MDRSSIRIVVCASPACAWLPATLCLNPAAHMQGDGDRNVNGQRTESRGDEGGEGTPTVAAPADVEGVDADGVARGHVRPVAGVVEHEGEHAVQHLDEVLAVLLVLETTTTTMAGMIKNTERRSASACCMCSFICFLLRREKRGKGKFGCWKSRTRSEEISLSLSLSLQRSSLGKLSYQRDDDLAVTAGGEGVLAGELLPDLLVVVDLPIGLKSNQREKHSSWIVAYVSCGR